MHALYTTSVRQFVHTYHTRTRMHIVIDRSQPLKVVAKGFVLDMQKRVHTAALPRFTERFTCDHSVATST